MGEVRLGSTDVEELHDVRDLNLNREDGVVRSRSRFSVDLTAQNDSDGCWKVSHRDKDCEL